MVSNFTDNEILKRNNMKKETVEIILGEMLVTLSKSTPNNITEIVEGYAEKIVKLFAMPVVSQQSEQVCDHKNGSMITSDGTFCRDCGENTEVEQTCG